MVLKYLTHFLPIGFRSSGHQRGQAGRPDRELEAKKLGLVTLGGAHTRCTKPPPDTVRRPGPPRLPTPPPLTRSESLRGGAHERRQHDRPGLVVGATSWKRGATEGNRTTLQAPPSWLTLLRGAAPPDTQCVARAPAAAAVDDTRSRGRAHDRRGHRPGTAAA